MTFKVTTTSTVGPTLAIAEFRVLCMHSL